MKLSKKKIHYIIPKNEVREEEQGEKKVETRRKRLVLEWK